MKGKGRGNREGREKRQGRIEKYIYNTRVFVSSNYIQGRVQHITFYELVLLFYNFLFFLTKANNHYLVFTGLSCFLDIFFFLCETFLLISGNEFSSQFYFHVHVCFSILVFPQFYFHFHVFQVYFFRTFFFYTYLSHLSFIHRLLFLLRLLLLVFLLLKKGPEAGDGLESRALDRLFLVF